MKFLTGLSALALIATSSAAAAATPCVTTAEAESIALVAMPEIIRQTGQACAAVLPATALIRQTSGPSLAQYDSAANRAWPPAQAALAHENGSASCRERVGQSVEIQVVVGSLKKTKKK